MTVSNIGVSQSPKKRAQSKVPWMVMWLIQTMSQSPKKRAQSKGSQHDYGIFKFAGLNPLKSGHNPKDMLDQNNILFYDEVSIP